MPTSPILDVVELYNGRGGELREDSSHTAQRVYHVKTVSGLTDTAVVLRAGDTPETTGGPRIPKRGEHYQAPDGSFDLTLRVKTVRAIPNRAHDLWLVTVDYVSYYTAEQLRNLGSGGGPGSDPDGGIPDTRAIPGLDVPEAGGEPGGSEGGGSLAPIENPLLRAPKVSYHAVNRTKVVDKHRADWVTGDPDDGAGGVTDQPGEGDAVLNSAGAPFDPPIEVEEGNLGVTITFNVRTFDAGDIRRFKGAINATTWRGQDARTVKCVDLGASQNFEAGVWYWEVTAKLEFSPPGEPWNPKRVLDRGAWCWRSGKESRVRDKQGNPIGQALLDGGGAQLAYTAPPAAPPVPKYRNVYAYREEDFDELF